MRRRIVASFILIALIAAGTAYAVGYHHPKAEPVAPVTNGVYAAMGDSIAAGDGLSPYSDASACNRSDQAYPHLVAAKLGYKLNDYACSGAATTTGILGSQTVNEFNETPQLTSLIASKTPEYVTITIGINDIDWTDLVMKCVTATCGSSSDTAMVEHRIDGAVANIKTIFDRIQAAYPKNPPKVVVVGYYHLYDSGDLSCPDATGIDAGEATWINHELDTLNKETASVVSTYPFTRAVTPDFSNHELCSDTPWLQGLTDKAPYHPNEEGQKALATAILGGEQS